MWKLCHKLFGWHYILMMYGSNAEILKVKCAPNKKHYIVVYGKIILKEDWNRWKPLTWLEEKPNE